MKYTFKNPAFKFASILIGCIFTGELIIMIAFTKFLHIPEMAENLLDPLLLSIFCTPLTYYLFFIPMTDKMAAQEKIESQLRISAAAFQTHDAIMITDVNSTIIRVNNAFEKVTGYKESEVVGKKPSILQSGRHDEDFYDEMWEKILANGIWTGEIWDRNKSGVDFPSQTTITAVKNENGETVQYVAVFTNVSGRKNAEQEIYNLAFLDTLTGLPNRRLLQDRLELALAASKRKHHFGALLLLDLDNFKSINDTLGHEYGDLLLVTVANRLKGLVRETDTVARFGGDEFIIVLNDLGSDSSEAMQNVTNFSNKLRELINEPFNLNGNLRNISFSIGICMFFNHDNAIEDLYKRADMAMYQAKLAGKNRVRFFDPHLQSLMDSRTTVESDLRIAIKKNHIQLYYQVQMNHKGRPIGAEALVRWKHPERGMISPASFIPIAEESSLIVDLGNCVLNQACEQLAKWSKQETTKDLVLAVNISPRQFMQPDFVVNVESKIQENKIKASRLKLEITESVAMDNLDLVINKMQTLKDEIGVTLSLDDFGTGFSSLSYLNRLPLDQIKIDQSFVRNMAKDKRNAMMVKNIINMARNFGLNVIAEGVETQEQLELLKKYGCKYYQGYLFSKPIPIEQFEVLLIENVAPLVK